MTFSTIIRRSFSKAAPLATKFIASQKTTATTTLHRVILSPRATVYSAGRRFCSNSAVAAVNVGVSSDKKLVEVFKSEIQVVEQVQGKTVSPPSDYPFSIEDNPGEQTITLTREYGGETITVEVSMPDTGEELRDDDDDDDDDEVLRTGSNVPLLVTVVKKGENAPYLEFDCSAYPDEISINGLLYKNPETEDHLAYGGPNFDDLDESLQKAFYKYLEIRGIKPSNTNFLHEYMIEKDTKEYVRWLKDVKDFVEA